MLENSQSARAVFKDISLPLYGSDDLHTFRDKISTRADRALKNIQYRAGKKFFINNDGGLDGNCKHTKLVCITGSHLVSFEQKFCAETLETERRKAILAKIQEHNFMIEDKRPEPQRGSIIAACFSI